ncbi:Hypothetical protein SMAX5B_018986 [Scophthalmus maximus]|uniref:Uncharacterized protein n=1 Tax=Scophthalmus maximus TaxID=52904 RepID=A0A2U9C4Z2_SCOMX|nr:Hypothetical protein SMAX5B_018986 [Scophthalmus maximus]
MPCWMESRGLGDHLNNIRRERGRKWTEGKRKQNTGEVPPGPWGPSSAPEELETVCTTRDEMMDDPEEQETDG